jgi:hypothetical protein
MDMIVTIWLADHYSSVSGQTENVLEGACPGGYQRHEELWRVDASHLPC